MRVAGLGVALLTRHALNLELATGVLKELPVEELPLYRSWCLVQAKAKRLSPVAMPSWRSSAANGCRSARWLSVSREAAGACQLQFGVVGDALEQLALRSDLRWRGGTPCGAGLPADDGFWRRCCVLRRAGPFGVSQCEYGSFRWREG
jgi:hypothetical protein